MRFIARFRPTPALVVASIALLVSLAGTSLRRRLRPPVALAAVCCAVLVAATSVPALAGNGAARPALAAAPGGDATIVSKDFVVAAGETGEEAVMCRSGFRATSGGVSKITSGVLHQIEMTAPVDETGSSEATKTGDVARGWMAQIYNYGQTSGTFRVFAVCSATSDATVQAESFTVSGAPVTHVEFADCPEGTRSVGGGVSSGHFLIPNHYVLATAPSREVSIYNVGWEAAVRQFGAGTLGYTVFALCSRVKAAVARVSVPLPNGYASGTASCKAGMRAVGGGAFIAPADDSIALDDSVPLANGTTTGDDVPRRWLASGASASNAAHTLLVYAICISDAPAVPKASCAGKRATIVGTAGADTLKGTPGADVIAALGGADTIAGLAGDDTICGGDGNDRVNAGAGNDTVFGGRGNDTITGGPGKDTIDGGPGRNTIRP